jgi:hypothetical protein
MFVALVGWDHVRLTLFINIVKMLLHAKENWVWRIVDYIPFPSFIPLRFSHGYFIFWQCHDSITTLQMVLL